MDVSVVIPTLNGGPRFGQVVEALCRQTLARQTDFVVVDSGSTDGTRERAKAAGFRLLDVPRAEFNHGATRDRAIAECGSDLVALLVQDAVPLDEHWLQRLTAPFADPKVAGTFSRQISIPGGNPILQQRLEQWVAGKDQPHRGQLPAGQSFDELTPFERLEQVAFDNVASCIRRSLWQQHPFGHRPFGEDIGWATWAVQQGHAIVFAHDSRVEHSHDRGWLHETRRIYCDHRNLHGLLGIETVPQLGPGLQARKAALAQYQSILAAAALKPDELSRRERWAYFYSWGEILAQWLAPRVNRSGERGLLGMLDRRLRQGI